MINKNNETHTEITDSGSYQQSIDLPFFLSKNTAEPTHQQWLHSKIVTHNPKAGLNPLVDAAAFLFSMVGKLKQLESYQNLAVLHQDLISEINTFQSAAKAQGYSSEYILVSRYALGATLDDLISHTPWGGEDRWVPYSILSLFNQDGAQSDRFFLILERIIKEPALYIDVMEFMYICLSLGYQGIYRAGEWRGTSLENVIHALYQRIRVYQGDFSKVLSPYPVKPTSPVKIKHVAKVSYWLTFCVTGSIIMSLFIGLGYILDTNTRHAYQELAHIGKPMLYEKNQS